MINRILESEIRKRLFAGKAIIVTGPRQVGKTTLIKKIIHDMTNVLFLDGDDPTIMKLLDRPDTEQIRQIIGKNKIVFIDESQRIHEIGLTAKIIVDQMQSVQLILSGSSSFDLLNQTNEPLTGRKWTFSLWPVSWIEWQANIGYVRAEQDLGNRLVYGFYPDVLVNQPDQEIVLKELTESYLYKDILIFGNIKKPDSIQKLVQALAWQVGNEVVYAEVGGICGLDPKTVASYIEILERAGVLFCLPSFSRNLRNEIRTGRKIYFYDNGIRNAVIGQFQPIQLRKDIGVLWENFLISERRKIINYSKSSASQYFWRTKQQQEVDYVEVYDSKVLGFEFKWNQKHAKRLPTTFTNAYSSIDQCITTENFREFVHPSEFAIDLI
ncbi:MAG: ATP-binding protein [Bacteroidota bacterium]